MITGGNDKSQKGFRGELVSLAFDMGFMIAIPIVVLTLGGKLVDNYFSTSPLFLLIGVLISTVVSTYLVFKKVKNLIK